MYNIYFISYVSQSALDLVPNTHTNSCLAEYRLIYVYQHTFPSQIYGLNYMILSFHPGHTHTYFISEHSMWCSRNDIKSRLIMINVTMLTIYNCINWFRMFVIHLHYIQRMVGNSFERRACMFVLINLDSTSS